MRQGKRHIVNAWILLICFVAGQYMVFAHQHNITKKTVKVYNIPKSSAQQTVTEKCQLCDAMHHNSMVLDTPVYFNAVIVAEHTFKTVQYSFTSIQLILSGGRAPPSANYFA